MVIALFSIYIVHVRIGRKAFHLFFASVTCIVTLIHVAVNIIVILPNIGDCIICVQRQLREGCIVINFACAVLGRGGIIAVGVGIVGGRIVVGRCAINTAICRFFLGIIFVLSRAHRILILARSGGGGVIGGRGLRGAGGWRGVACRGGGVCAGVWRGVNVRIVGIGVCARASALLCFGLIVRISVIARISVSALFNGLLRLHGGLGFRINRQSHGGEQGHGGEESGQAAAQCAGGGGVLGHPLTSFQ